jgi:hypothetical protein
MYEEASDESLQDYKCFTAAEIISSINAEVQYVQELLKVNSINLHRAPRS